MMVACNEQRTHCARSSRPLAATLCALRRLPATGMWLWLERAWAGEQAAATGMVLFHHLSGLLLAAGPEVFRHG